MTQHHIRDIIRALRQIAAHTPPSHVIKAGLVTLNAHNIYTHRPLNVTSVAAWKTCSQ
jgi:hypothetical protein